MPLQDHFRPPLSECRHWHAFYNAWATYIASALNEQLPPGYFAEPNVQFGVEIDVATFEEAHLGTVAHESSAGWKPPEPLQTIPFAIATDVVEVLVFDRTAGPVLVGALELISPANKDRRSHRDAFVSKCITYLHQGAGLVIVDVVTGRSGNLHDELIARVLGAEVEPRDLELYAAAYRPIDRDAQLMLDLWCERLTVGDPLPTMPLWLPGALSVAVDLEATYERTCREQRLLGNGA